MMVSLHQRAKEVFLDALARPSADRAAFLASACGDDTALRAEVASLLEFHDEDGDVAGDRARPEFAPGDVFATRYRMVTRIGHGGMGDVWRAEDLVLEAPVALKLIYSASPDARVRILNEVRLARRITHPAVCRVFDFGEDAGQAFYSMEFVPGEDLAKVLRRVGRFPTEKVVEIAHQLCGGLSAAHAQRVLHRDLKPANILIDNDGRVRITDFGIAVTPSETGGHTMIGTPGYMAPEQLQPGAELTERTDVYALGIVLYELVTGRHPFDGSVRRGAPPRPSTIVTEVDLQLERAIMQALSPNPHDRPNSAAALAARLPAVAAESRPQRFRLWVAAAALAAAAIGIAVWPSWLQRSARALTAQDTIVLADFMNTTGDPVFDGALKVALAVALEQSPFLKIFPDERVRETLRLMERSPDEAVTRSIAREVAQREHLKALISGSIGSLGTNYVLALEAINAETGDVMARDQIEAAGKEQVLASLGRAASRLREKLGESLASIQRFDTPLPRATTPSLDALHAYSLALDEGRINLRLAAIPHLKRAIALDPNFALALAMLSGVYANTSQQALAPEFTQRAFDLRDRVSERERFFISWRYFRDATQDGDGALELAKEWAATYPRESVAFNSLGLAYTYFGQHEPAIVQFRESIRLEPKFSAPYGNLAETLIAVNRLDEAKDVLQQARAQQINTVTIGRVSYVLAFVKGDTAGMEREIDAAAEIPEANGYSWQARTSGYAGQIRAAHEQYRQGSQLANDRELRELASDLIAEDAEVHALAGQCVTARSEAGNALAASRAKYTLQRTSRVFGLCGDSRQAEALTNEFTRRFAHATLTVRVMAPVTNALLAVQRRDFAGALELLAPVRQYDRAEMPEFWPAYLRGLAHLQLRQPSDAAAEFASIIDHRGEMPHSPLVGLARLGIARAATAAGDLPRARDAYESALAQWATADPDLPALNEARRELARLNEQSR